MSTAPNNTQAARISTSEEIFSVAAPLCILGAPLVGFLEGADYGYGAAEVLGSFAILILLGLLFGALLVNVANRPRAVALLFLLTAAADFLFPFAELYRSFGERIGGWLGPEALAGWIDAGWVGIATAVIVGYLAVFTILLALGKAAIVLCALGFGALAGWFLVDGAPERDRAFVERAGAAAQPDAAAAPVVHLILDGHNAVGGLRGEGGDSLRAALERDYPARGFRLYRHAYSQYYDAWNGVPALMNFDAPTRDAAWLDPGRPALAAAAWFGHLAERGYAIDVRQTDRLDLCAGAPELIARCVTWRGASAGALAAADLPALERFRLLWGLYVERSDIYKAVRGIWRRHAVPLAGGIGLDLPAWSGQGQRLDSLVATAMAERTAAALRGGGAGRAWIVHLPAAGAPYVHDESCGLNPEPDRWLGPYDRAQPAPRRNDARGRALRHKRANAQLGCVHERLGAIIDAIDETPALAGATVAIHGSHGSHIVEHEPFAAQESLAGADDFVDGFSTFLAVRTPGLAAGVEDRPTPLQATFPTFFGAPAAGDGAPVLYLRDRAGGALAPRPANDLFGGARQE